MTLDLEIKRAPKSRQSSRRDHHSQQASIYRLIYVNFRNYMEALNIPSRQRKDETSDAGSGRGPNSTMVRANGLSWWCGARPSFVLRGPSDKLHSYAASYRFV